MSAARTHGLTINCLIGVLFGLFMITTPVFADAVIENVDFEQTDGKLRLRFTLSEATEHHLFRLNDPERLVIDLNAARLDDNVSISVKPSNGLLGVRHAVRNQQDYRVVLDLKDKMEINSALIDDAGSPQLVVELFNEQTLKAIEVVDPTQDLTPRDIVVVVDAGHGGKDPGAIGKAGTREKDIVLSIARQLHAAINQQAGFVAHLTRDDDRFIPLKQRTEIAREHQADLFVSVHADAAENRRARGASVFTLSANGASSEAAKWLAERENSADLVGGVRIVDKDPVIASVLLDLSQRHTNKTSEKIAGVMLTRLKQVGDTHSDRVEQAGFVVLKSPDIPSVLVESAFLSNPSEEKKLRSQRYQTQLVQSLLKGIKEYFRQHPPEGTLLATLREKEYVIKSGDTLSGIASLYEIPLKTLKQVNKLNSDVIRVGQVLQIPQG